MDRPTAPTVDWAHVQRQFDQYAKNFETIMRQIGERMQALAGALTETSAYHAIMARMMGRLKYERRYLNRARLMRRRPGRRPHRS